MAHSTTAAAVRLDPDQAAACDALAARLSKRAAGAHISRSHVLRQVIARGIEAFTRELDREDAKARGKSG